MWRTVHDHIGQCAACACAKPVNCDEVHYHFAVNNAREELRAALCLLAALVDIVKFKEDWVKLKNPQGRTADFIIPIINKSVKRNTLLLNSPRPRLLSAVVAELIIC